MLRTTLVVSLCSLFIFVTCSNQIITSSAGYYLATRTVTLENKKYSYFVYLPVYYTASEQWPVMLYLHESGATGNVWRIAGDLGIALRQNPEKYPCIIVFPECPTSQYWIGDRITYAMKALDQTVEEFNGDPKRLLCSGVSMGGYGTWISGVLYPQKFAALATVSSGVIPPVVFTEKEEARLAPPCQAILKAENPYDALAKAIGQTPCWLFHGADDSVVPVTESRNIVEAIKDRAGRVEYTELASQGHAIAGAVYTDEVFLRWLFKQRRQ